MTEGRGQFDKRHLVARMSQLVVRRSWRFMTNPTLQAGRIGIEESRAQEVTAYLRRTRNPFERRSA
jgi:hypothetical protein